MIKDKRTLKIILARRIQTSMNPYTMIRMRLKVTVALTRAESANMSIEQ
jgi:hypothetical protein